MSLEQKLQTICNPRIPSITRGHAETIAEFWEQFVQPKLLSKTVVKKWWNFLKKYVDDDDSVLAIRTYGNGADWDRDLRRGFYNLTNSGHNFFYTDNFFTAYFFKMAVDDYLPKYDEFKMLMSSRKFPARFGRSCASERDRAAFSLNGKDPGFATAGYKISHIVDSGNHIWNGRENWRVSDICDRYFDRGEYEDWTIHRDQYGEFYARDLDVLPEAQKYLKAIFLRMTCPLNYVLTPKKNLHSTEVHVRQNDIGESDELQQYAMAKFHELYGEVYEDYLGRICLERMPDFSFESGNFNVGITYGDNVDELNQQNQNTGLQENRPRRTASPNQFSDQQRAQCLKAYLFEGLSFRNIEIQILGLGQESRGFRAQTMMRSFNLVNENKGVLCGQTVDHALAHSDGYVRVAVDFILRHLES